MKNKLDISLIIPCRNEAEGIASLVKRTLAIADEVILVDNQSTDDTVLLAKKAGARVIKESRVDKLGIGYGYSLLRGIKAAKHEVIITLDGDGTYPVDQIEKAVSYMKNKRIDMLLCSRFPLINGQAISWWRQLGVWILNTETRLLCGYPIKDILSGMWVIKRSAFNLLQLKQGGWNLSPEIKLAAIIDQNITIDQFHIYHYEREFGQSKQKLVLTGLQHVWFIFIYCLKHVGLLWLKSMGPNFNKSWRLIKKVEV